MTSRQTLIGGCIWHSLVDTANIREISILLQFAVTVLGNHWTFLGLSQPVRKMGTINTSYPVTGKYNMKYQNVKSRPSSLYKLGLHKDGCFSNPPVCCSTQPKNATSDDIIKLKKAIGFIYLAGHQPSSSAHLRKPKTAYSVTLEADHFLLLQKKRESSQSHSHIRER